MVSKSKIIEVIYVELDAMLDTRLGTVARLDDAAATKLLMQGYHTRESDYFDCVNHEDYTKLYQERDIETLKLSGATNMLKLVRHLIGVLQQQAETRPYHNGSKLVINLYPYVLDAEEEEAIGKSISVWMQGIAPVELTYIQPKDLTPIHCKQTYSMMIVYEYGSWLNLHADAFKQTRLPEVTMFVPAIYFIKVPTSEELEDTVKGAAHPLRAIELLASPIVDLKLIDITYFSILSK